MVFLVVAGAIALNIWSKELTRLAFVPSGRFVEQSPLASNAYQDPAMWLSRPGMGVSDPARWQPAIEEAETDQSTATPAPADEAKPRDFAVFFVHPTSFLDRDRWNASLDDAEANRVANVYVKGMASPFNQASEIWAPRYRQATFGAFLTDSAEATKAIDAAYRDVRDAFRVFLASVDPDDPIVLAGHSQGSLHLLRLIREEVNGKPLAGRVAAVRPVRALMPCMLSLLQTRWRCQQPRWSRTRRGHPRGPGVCRWQIRWHCHRPIGWRYPHQYLSCRVILGFSA